MRPIIAFLAAAASFGSIAITASPSQAETYMCIKNGGAYTLKAELHGTKGTSSENLTNPNSNCFNLDTIGTEVGDSYKLVVKASGATTGGGKQLASRPQEEAIPANCITKVREQILT